MSKVVFIDLCGTLVEENTTFDFFQKKILPKRNKVIVFLWRAKIVQIITKLCGFIGINLDLTKISCLYIMKGYSKNELSKLSDEYIEDLNWRNSIVSKVSMLKNNGYKPVIVSASLDFLVESVARKLNIMEYHSSLLSYDKNNLFLGSLLLDLQGQKMECILETAKDRSIFFTDNHDDVNCIDLVDYFIAISSLKSYSYWRKYRVSIHVI